jgi:UDP-2-acetamido-3-amino-2,3-dideoxy-glucuronate N-acetyltransferase
MQGNSVDNIFIHPTSLVETHHIGRGTQIWAFAHVVKSARIGACCTIGDHCFIASGVKIGDNVTIKHGNKIWSGVTLDNGGFVGPSHLSTTRPYSLRTDLAGLHTRHKRDWLVTTHIQEGAWIKANAIVQAGILVGEFAVVGVGAVVMQDVPAYALVVGKPAQIQGWICQCGQPLNFHNTYAQCECCNLNYTRVRNTVKLATF